MTKETTTKDKSANIKSGLHPKNPLRFRYDFDVLGEETPELKAFIHLNKHGVKTVNFSLPEAVKALNKALLKHHYGIEFWNIPDGYLCPPVPGRADYLHYVADLLKNISGKKLPNGKKVNVLDIGTGANLIYPIIGNRTFRWNFVGSEVDPLALKCANEIKTFNENISKYIEIRKQNDLNSIFHGIIQPDEYFDLTICNPPFFKSVDEAERSNNRKVRNLGIQSSNNTLNFGGQNTEFWTKGGEKAFIDKMIKQSEAFSKQVLWFTTLVSKKKHLSFLQARLKKAKVINVKIIEMAQGQKSSHILCWTFFSKKQQAQWADMRWK